MYLQTWMLFLLALSFTDMGASGITQDPEVIFDTNDDFDIRQNDRYPFHSYPFLPDDANNIYPENKERDREYGRRCTDKMERALETIRRRQLAKEKMLHLNGYSLHQPLKSAPFDMYVTDMRVRLPPSKSWVQGHALCVLRGGSYQYFASIRGRQKMGLDEGTWNPINDPVWVKVDRCSFNPINHSLETRLLFNDLTISGRVNLFNDGELQRESLSPNPEESCNMILRLRKAGIGFHTEPIRRERGQFNVKTDSHFLEPGFISVYAYGCEPGLKRRDAAIESRDYASIVDEEEEIGREMEDIFLKGIRSLLTSYMQKELQPAIKETLMKNMGYTVSYG